MGYDRRRTSELLARRRQLRDDELERLARKVDVIDMELCGLRRLRAAELRRDLEAAGYDVSAFTLPSFPTDAERTARRRHGQPPVDPIARARAE